MTCGSDSCLTTAGLGAAAQGVYDQYLSGQIADVPTDIPGAFRLRGHDEQPPT